MSEWAERLAIQDVIFRYIDMLRRGAWDEYESIWSPDAIWEVGAPVGLKVEGLAAIKKVVRDSRDAGGRIFPMTTCPIVTLVGDSKASATSTVQAIIDQPGASMVVYGIYHDNLVREGGTWRFSHRRLETVYVEPGDLPGRWM